MDTNNWTTNECVEERQYAINVGNKEVMCKYNSVIENEFTYHTPTQKSIEKFPLIRAKARELAYLINELVPAGGEKVKAMSALNEAVFWANAGISRNQDK